MQKKVIILGVSGSIGKNSVAVIKKFSQKFVLCAFSVHTNLSYAVALSKEYPTARIAVTADIEHDFEYSGTEGLRQLLFETDADIVINGISGMAGLAPSIWTLQSKKNLALANKESLVMAGSLLKKLACDQACEILPIDSEHAAVFQLIHGRHDVAKIILTASGGPFRTLPKAQLSSISPKQAKKHPTWSMGEKISIDSATLANKALEVIEAVHLFDFSPDCVEVLVHPQSIVHSMVSTYSGELYAQLSEPNMQNPILFALCWPDFPPMHLKPIDLAAVGRLDFEAPRRNDFPMLDLGYEAARQGGSYPIIFNAANECAVEAFVKNQIGFLDISLVVQKSFDAKCNVVVQPDSFEQVYEIDRKARLLAQSIIDIIIAEREAL